MTLQKVTALTGTGNERLTSIRYSFDGGLTAMVDPATVAKVIQLGITIYNLFKKNEDPLEKIGDWIVELGDEVKKIGEDLKEVKRELQNLKVYIDEVQVKDAEISLMSAIDTYKQHIFNLKEHPNNKDYINTFRDLYFQQISISANKLKRYSFAAVYTLGYALKVELELITALKLGKESRREVLRDYLNYFTNCLDPNITGSVGNVLTALTNTRNEMIKQFQNGGTWFNTFQYLDNAHEVFEERVKEGVRHWTEYNLITIQLDYQIKGDLLNGFTGQLVLPPSKKSVAGPVKSGETSAYRNETDAINAARKHFEDTQLSRYNAQVPIYKALDENFNILKEVEKACLSLIELCKTRLAEID